MFLVTVNENDLDSSDHAQGIFLSSRKPLNVRGKRVKMLKITRFYPFKRMFYRVI
jgi:hypothetical protein